MHRDDSSVEVQVVRWFEDVHGKVDRHHGVWKKVGKGRPNINTFCTSPTSSLPALTCPAETILVYLHFAEKVYPFDRRLDPPIHISSN